MLNSVDKRKLKLNLNYRLEYLKVVCKRGVILLDTTAGDCISAEVIWLIVVSEWQRRFVKRLYLNLASIHLSIYLSTYLSCYLSILICVRAYIYIYLYIYMCVSVYVCVCLSMCVCDLNNYNDKNNIWYITVCKY
jgi:hypothetical protein